MGEVSSVAAQLNSSIVPPPPPPPPPPLLSPPWLGSPLTMMEVALVATKGNCLEVEIVVDDDHKQQVISHENNNLQLMKGGGDINPEDWLPITESRNGNTFYSAFHILNSGIGFQALSLPLAFTFLGWVWGIVCLSIAFGWQLYTLWLLTQLHESNKGVRYSRYIHLAKVAFGEKQGKFMALFPIMYLSGGTCVALVTLGGGTMMHFFSIVCGDTYISKNLTTVEWFLVFAICATVLAQLPNLNSVAGVSLIGAITAIIYCTLIWVVSVIRGRVAGSSYEPLQPYKSETAKAFSILNAIGIIVLAFRGHNLILEIQGTLPSTREQQAKVPMWKGVKYAYFLIAMCLYPLAIGGYWAYGNLIPTNYGMLKALYKFHVDKNSKVVLGFICLFVVVHCLCSFQMYAMPVFDNLEFAYISFKKRPCPRWLRTGFRLFFGCLAFFIAVALPVLTSLAGLLGGIAMPITLAYPCFMWVIIKKPKPYSPMWIINLALGILGMSLSFLVIAGAVWSIVDRGLEPNFFRPP